jgi:hypothetical protein
MVLDVMPKFLIQAVSEFWSKMEGDITRAGLEMCGYQFGTQAVQG